LDFFIRLLFFCFARRGKKTPRICQAPAAVIFIKTSSLKILPLKGWVRVSAACPDIWWKRKTEKKMAI